jgi:hypothetical protein
MICSLSKECWESDLSLVDRINRCHNGYMVTDFKKVATL